MAVPARAGHRGGPREGGFRRALVGAAVAVGLGKLEPEELTRILDAAVKANAKTTARFNEYGLAPAYGPRHIGSGPGFVTKDNIGKVEKYAGQFR